jgi:hypothetical protein
MGRHRKDFDTEYSPEIEDIVGNQVQEDNLERQIQDLRSLILELTCSLSKLPLPINAELQRIIEKLK